MEFSFDRRGKTIVYEQLEHILAGPREALSDPPGRLKGRLERYGLSWALEDDRPYSPSWRIFEDAGWAFVHGASKTVSKAFTGPDPFPEIDLRWVFRDAFGEIRLGTQCFAVQMNPLLRTDEAEARLAADGFTLVHAMRFGTNLFEVRVRESPGWPAIKARLSDRSAYTWAEPLFLEALPGRGNPDPGLGDQWHHAKLRTAQAWETTLGKGVRIAIIDNGMDVRHPDLANRVESGGYYLSKAPCGGEFHRLEKGKEAAFPRHDHGTFCMGLAGAERDNGRDGCGIAPEARLMAIACATDQTTTQYTLARAVAFAADPATEESGLASSDGADVLACSLGSVSGSWSMTYILEQALDFARNAGREKRGLPIFWAITNRVADISDDEVCSNSNVIAIGQSSEDDVVVKCGYGDPLAFLAPGYLVYSTTGNNAFGKNSGTSYACPIAAGVAALVLSHDSTLTRDQVLKRLLESCVQIGDPVGGYDMAGRHPRYGHGRINADWAVNGK
jgi:thermitase